MHTDTIDVRSLIAKAAQCMDRDTWEGWHETAVTSVGPVTRLWRMFCTACSEGVWAAEGQ